MSSMEMSKEVMKLWKQSWESYVRTMEAMQEQGEKMMELMLGQNPFLPEEMKKIFRDWTGNARKMQKMYIDLIQENIRKMEEALEKK